MRSIDLQKEIFSEKERRNVEILEILRKRAPISRPDISKEMGVNVVTISNYIDDFIRQRLVYEKEMDVSEGGRRPVLLDLNPHMGLVIGVGLNLSNMVGVLVDLKGNILTKTQIARPKASVKEVNESLLEIIREILRRSKDDITNIKGIGIGIAGLINKNDNSIYWPQKIDNYYTYTSVDLPIKDLIEKEFNLPTLIENDATCACFGEHWLDLDHNYKNIIYMFSGVGCGIMMNGQLYTGTNGYAGETAIYNYKDDGLFNCQPAQNCFLKRWEADLGIVNEVKRILLENKEAQKEFVKLTSAQLEDIDLKAVFIAARAKNNIALLVLEAAAQRLGIKTAFLVNLLNPQKVIIGGGLEDAGDEFLNKLTQTVNEWAFRESVSGTKFGYSQLRENAVAVGAASLVVQKVFAHL